ncbi:type III restriction endonuclease subunit R [Terasakiella brassicae]|uniref:Type III restriction endonuclease subunit R n=1 Tax=Terasakiella brassicae TaxID=1634917 RepID=A0A917FGM0_9PROT|nr:DEAD/DEAH box helicase family protein [Terasakiella brassicae]GGF75708.1 type III restriction endonuclease subunit R [Terasakiella brassicae]
MKLRFDPSLEYQWDAINAVVRAFEGQPIAQSQFEISATTGTAGMALSDLGAMNDITLNEDAFLENVRKVQEANDIPAADELLGREFSVEMETGTGKTYVYLRTIFELNKQYGLKKFIIVVPSVAIREGVLKSIEVTKDHFQTIYGNVPFDSFVYDSKKLGKVRQFANSNQIQIMVINIQSFVKDVPDKDTSEMTDDELKKLNVINRQNDKMSGRKPIEFIQASNPIVIIDEPQSVDNTAKAKGAIARLNPVATLRYSATHKNPYNLLYKLDPIKAYDLRLVKRIEVASVIADDNANDAYVKLEKVDYKASPIKAKLKIFKSTPKGPQLKPINVKQGDDLYLKSGENPMYENGFVIAHIDGTPGGEGIEFNTGTWIDQGDEIGGMRDDTMREQVFETVRQHFIKEKMLKDRGIKVLSLFFIDKVSNYRVYNDDGTTSLGQIGQWFEEAYNEVSSSGRFKGVMSYTASEVHDGYFSQDKKKGCDKDTTGKTKEDEDTYNLIMRDKERLLDPDEPLRFIFSHSALREGWDNPNVFQICTLNETQSTDRKRQEIGRGLRLPVNSKGERVHDEHINRLTVIANESYEVFAKSLQAEFEEDFGIKFGRLDKIAFSKLLGADGETPIGQEQSGRIWSEMQANGYINKAGEILEKFDPKAPGFDLAISDEFSDLKAAIIDEASNYIFQNRIADARKRETLKFNKAVQIDTDFQELWEQIKHRTRYRVNFDTNDLIAHAVYRIKELPAIKAMEIQIDKVEVGVSKAGIDTDTVLDHRTTTVSPVKVLPDILAYLQKETELTRHTLVEILKQSGRLAEFKINPQQFMALVAREISRALHDLMLDGIQYEKVPGLHWEMSLLEREAEDGITRYLSNLYAVQNRTKTLYDHIEFDSEVERKFAQDLDNNENVKLFVKLPQWFKIDTPIGSYNPDWAFVTERDEKLYFVRETKSTTDKDDLRNKENQKIKCGQRHFDAIGVDYGVVTKLSEVSF